MGVSWTCRGRVSGRRASQLAREADRWLEANGERWAALQSRLLQRDYAPLQALTAADALRDLHSGGTPTVPTRRGGDPRHAAPMRLDYAHATPALLAICPN